MIFEMKFNGMRVKEDLPAEIMAIVFPGKVVEERDGDKQGYLTFTIGLGNFNQFLFFALCQIFSKISHGPLKYPDILSWRCLAFKGLCQ